ncbi:MAG: iron-sulfur cluster assembly scaffold protein [Paracoccus sp. (in: a-proteobacteria)]|uniref:iron-sulfur cluster assembly scaffold protein n=1 Tax=Paracoccus sp. TaxID=267 RepID=UPI0026DFE983|nr:iron-sulfur cluster assembly scaffold protein [Paracoccus sp. (in: a-proteobacteria)]MDO5631453.1 iron-sulfur cluster assembly scaffold protein [Paracoccus sp. (in: a-proteobacteria)]
MPDQDLMQLYSRRILALTAAIPHLGRLPAPQGSAMRRSPQCGSSVTVDVVLNGEIITDFAQEVRACALGQASAAVLGAAVIGRSRDEITATRDALEAMLKHGGPVPAAPFDALEALSPARDFPNRHASILLAWDATLAAFDSAQASAA